MIQNTEVKVRFLFRLMVIVSDRSWLSCSSMVMVRIRVWLWVKLRLKLNSSSDIIYISIQSCVLNRSQNKAITNTFFLILNNLDV